MTTILAIDPGPTQSAWLRFDVLPEGHGIEPNAATLWRVRQLFATGDVVALVIETIEPWGGFTGPPALETMRAIGRFEEAAYPLPVILLKRSAVLRALGIGKLPQGQAQAAARACLIERYGGGNPARKDHPLHGITSHLWSALAVAVAYQEGLR